ncbi:hypothetical protein BX600DRAFT_533854 [Xylariales sp. PMI_506]|nr:hypothetical protein BX600DRAFT_533854 [Xylariales sp. PMI_506]
MPGVVFEWPAWPDFDASEQKSPFSADRPWLSYGEEFEKAKLAIIEEYGQEALKKGWLEACASLTKVTDEIIANGNKVIPILDMEEVAAGKVSDETISKLKETGCFIVRNVVDKAETEKLFADLKDYTTRNKGKYSAWPIETPAIYNLYNTPTQNAVRSHPNHLALVRWINGLWHFSETSGDVSTDPLVYVDAVRMRPPGTPFLGLGPHIDAGSLCRWADPTYRKAYGAVFSGRPGDHDCYDLDARKDAKQSMFPGSAHSTVFRAFQGWTALSRTAPREGTILLYPNVQTAIAYILLRPFFRPPTDPAKILDATAWEFDPENSWFPGTYMPDSQRLSDPSHPHLKIKECLIHVPELQPGDTVWWHTDVCHAVDPEHIGNEDASVAYIAATPTTKGNLEYMRQQYTNMVAGVAPQDFANHGSDETKFEGFKGFSEQPELFKRLMGF